MSDVYRSDIPYQNRHTIDIFNHNIVDIFHSFGLPVGSYKKTFIIFLDVTATGYGVVFFKRIINFGNINMHRPQAIRINGNFVLF